MSAESDHIRENFTRQRRNLIAMSLVILCFEFLGVHFHTLNLLGNKIDIKNQNLVHFALWSVLAYYLWRYWTYFNDLGDKGIINSFYSWRRPHIQDVIIARALDSDEVKSFTKENGDLSIGETSVNYIKSTPRTEIGFVRFNFYEKIPGAIIKQISVDFIARDRELLVPSLRSASHLIIRTRLFNEYLFPFIILALPIVFIDHTVVSWFIYLTNFF